MSRRRFYAPPRAYSADADSVTLDQDETRHLRDVLRLRIDDEVFVFDGEGREFCGVINDLSPESTVIAPLTRVAPARPESPLDLTLAVALLKGEKFDLVVQKGTELGVTSIVPVKTARADVKLNSDDDAARKAARWRRIALEAAKQCGRARLLKIEPVIDFVKLVTSDAAGAHRLLFAEDGGTSLADSGAPSSAIVAIVGSEGGWTGEEIDQAKSAGWRIVTLGGRTLRAETAAVTIAALLQHQFGDLK